MKKIKSSTMQAGDYGLYDGDIVRLHEQKDTRYLAYVCTIGDEYDGMQDNPRSSSLDEIIIDDDTEA